MWAAAFAFAEGRRDDARRALSRGLGAGDRSAAAALLALATETRDLDALHALAARDPALLPPPLAALRDGRARARRGAGSGRRSTSSTASAATSPAGRRSSADPILARWLPAAPGDRPTWPELLHELRGGARALDRLDLVGAVEALAVERERPLRVAVVGEFNAGKSTFLNALLGEDVAPTGVLPTTATLHWVAWAPDPVRAHRGAAARPIAWSRTPTSRARSRRSPPRARRSRGSTSTRRSSASSASRSSTRPASTRPTRTTSRPRARRSTRRTWPSGSSTRRSPMKETERQVLAEIQGLGVPVQILANKADRLEAGGAAPPCSRTCARASPRWGSASHAAPIAFSARLSLKGRLGDADALAASGWPEVEALISEQIVDGATPSGSARSGARPRARRGELALAAAARARQRTGRRGAAARARGEALREAAARLRREQQALATAIDAAIEPARALLQADLKPLGELPEERQRADRGLREYLRERFVARLADPVVAELVRGAFAPGQAAFVPPRGAAAVRAVLMGAVASHDAPAHLLERPLDRVLEAAAEAFAAALLVEAEEPEAEAPFAALELRAAALAEAFVAGPADPDRGAVVASRHRDASSAR